MLASSKRDLSIYTGKVRARVCGLLKENDQILLINHQSIGSAGHLWAPPGGGIEFGETAEQALIREFKEETGLTIRVQEFLFIYEFIGQKHHAIELFYKVKRTSGELSLGTDPELDNENQIINGLKFVGIKEIGKSDKHQYHGIFGMVNSSEEVLDLRGLFTFNH